MADESYDEDFERAIALSMQEQVQRNNVIDLTGDGDEDVSVERKFQEDVRKAVALSKADSQNSVSAPSQSRASARPSLFLAERAKMEEERRERQRKRRRDAGLNSDPEETGSVKRQNRTRSPSAKPSSSAVDTSDVFYNGSWRPTATRFSTPRRDGKATFRFTDVLGKKDEIAFAILSTYNLDLSWLYPFFDPSIPVILFMLLFHKSGRLRVVISTANLVDFDWRDIENFVWLQDIPRQENPSTMNAKDTQSFPAILQSVLRKLGVQAALDTMVQQGHPHLPLRCIDDLSKFWEFSAVKAHLVPSIVGKHTDWPNVIQTGHPRLMKAVRDMGLRAAGMRGLSLEYQGSSLGQYTSQWLNEFSHSARGESVEDWLRQSKKSREQMPLPALKIMFPTKRTVHQSALGEAGGGTIFCSRKKWKAPNFPRGLFHDSKSAGGPVLMHTKILVAKFTHSSHDGGHSDTETDEEPEEAQRPVGWAYVGSHNFSSAAWGTLSGSSFTPVLNVSNYEIGVVFPLRDAAALESVRVWQCPPPKYGRDDEPWIQEESAILAAAR
ncbi:phospholipase D/nuclease [Fistulina hepatica ATCC 64428]|uniref:Phospholipase D/nuclease n=1 Tax=Fistulina hepatica ATCC 64428 TaxID=1128425 RepID=A0A0D7A6M1_9AGAR|nr:phospholipase D/nuclease [Fistulina hepatica ATCC 64428]